MDFFTNAYLSLAIGIGALLGWIRYKAIDPAFRPFLFLVWAGLLHEAGSIVLVSKGYSNVLLFNLFILAEALLLCWQFFRWQVYSRRYFLLLFSFFLGCWTVEWFYTSLYSFSSYFVIIYSCTISLLSLSCINGLLFREATPLYRHPVFLLCFSFLVYFSISALVEIFWMFGLRQSKAFRLQVHALLCYINLFTNLLFALAILWMPTRHRSILRY